MKAYQQIKKITDVGSNACYKFAIMSRDFEGMEKAYYSMPHSFRRSQTGTGYCLIDGYREHEFSVRGIDRARHIVNHFKAVIRRRKRGGFQLQDLGTN